MRSIKVLERIRGWFPQEPRIMVSTRLNVDSDKKQPPRMIPPEYTVSATKVAVAFAVFWIILYGLLSFAFINFERYPVSIVQVVAWIFAGLVVGTTTSAIVTKSQLGRLSRDYQFDVNGKDLVILLVPIVLFFVFGVYVSLPFVGTSVGVSDIQGLYIGVLAWEISCLIIRAALFAAFEKKKDMRIMQSWWGGAMYLVPKAPQSQPNARGELLKFFLVAGIVGCVVAALGYVAVGLLLLANSQGGLSGVLSRLSIPLWTLTFYPILAIVNVCALVALYRWRKWGFYVLLASSLAAFTLNIAVLGFRLEFIAGLFGITIIYILLRPKWSLLKPGYPPIRKYLSLALAIMGVILLITSFTLTSHVEDRLISVPQGATVASGRFNTDQPVPDTEIPANLTTQERLHFEIIVARSYPHQAAGSSVTFTISNQSLSSNETTHVYFTNDKIGLPDDYYMFWSAPENGTYYFTLDYNLSSGNFISYDITKAWSIYEPVQVVVFTPLLAQNVAPTLILAALLFGTSIAVPIRNVLQKNPPQFDKA